MKGKVVQSTRSGFVIINISIRTNIRTVITFSQLISSTPIFSCSSVDFSLYHLNSFVSNGTYICSFCNILPDKLVGVLDSSFLL
ncbi:Uncharacterised protein [Prevotella nigrescens]|nr:Uncharacterised protein [Prevotella nigrescens]